MKTRDFLAALLTAAVLSSGCDAGSTEPKPGPLQPGIRVTAGAGISDTVDAIPAETLTVLVTGADGNPAAGARVLFEGMTARAGYHLPTMQVSPIGASEFLTDAADTTDAQGVASVRVRLGHHPGEGKILIRVPTLGYQDTARYTVKVGAPARTDFELRDTVISLERSLTLRAQVLDRFGHLRPETPNFSGSEGLTFTGATLSSSKFGQYRVRAAYPGTTSDSITVTAVPRGRLAAAIGRSDTLVMMDLDGSNQVRTTLPGTIQGIDWAPDGRVVAGAGVFFYGDPPRLQAVTSDGTFSPFLTGSTAASEAFPVFSGDGKTLLFVGHAPGSTILQSTVWRASADGTGARATPLPLYLYWGDNYGSSPDATKVVINGGIYDLQTGAGIRGFPFINHGHYVGDWRWSPRGDLLVFNGHYHMGVIRPDGTGYRVLSTDFLNDRDHTIDWSGDGDYLVRRLSAEFGLGSVRRIA